MVTYRKLTEIADVALACRICLAEVMPGMVGIAVSDPFAAPDPRVDGSLPRFQRACPGTIFSPVFST